MQVSIESIIVEDRFRRDMGDIEALKTSIQKLGLLQAIVVDKDRRLVCGGRRLTAAKALGWATIDAKVVDCDALMAEHDENEVRKAFTVSERVAIAEAVAERLKGRQGSNQFKAKGGGNISTSFEDSGKTRDLAAAKAGFGSGKTLEAAQAVIAKGAPELVAAMDKKQITISAAKTVADNLPPQDHAAVDYANPRAVKTLRDRAKRHANSKKSDNAAEANVVTVDELLKEAASPKPATPIKGDEQRLYEPDSSFSALVLAQRAKVAIVQINRNDPNAIRAIEFIQAILDKQHKLITEGKPS